MKEFIEKLIGRLEEINHTDYGSIGSYEAHVAVRDCLRDVKNIINQFAEEYKHCDLCYLGSPCEYQNPEISCEKCIEYDTEEHCCPKICKVITDAIQEMKEENNVGWIPYTTGGKMPNEASRVWLSFTTPIASFVKSAWYINGHFEWDNCKRVKETPMAWKPYNAPAPYQPKGE